MNTNKHMLPHFSYLVLLHCRAVLYYITCLFLRTSNSYMSNSLQLKAIITLRAMENQKINWVIRDEPLNDDDSGWQLYFGDEDEDYLENFDNSTLITLENVLLFEPKLAKAFASEHNAFEWDEASKEFVELEGYEEGEES